MTADENDLDKQNVEVRWSTLSLPSGLRFTIPQSFVYPERLTSVYESVTPVIETIVSMQRAHTAFVQNTAASLQRFIDESLVSFHEKMASLFQSIKFNFQPLIDVISAAQARSLADTLRSHYWWPVPGLPHQFYEGLLDLLDNGNTRQVNRYICNWFSWWRYRRLGRMVRRWEANRYFERRKHIYLQALEAHRRGQYNLSVPTLLPLLEGIAVDFLNEEYAVFKTGRKAIEEAIRTNTPPDMFNKVIQDTMIEFLAESTYERTSHGVLKSGYELNRHGVLHSIHLRYGREANSLRCFLWLETLYQYIDDSPEEVDWSVRPTRDELNGL